MLTSNRNAAVTITRFNTVKIDGETTYAYLANTDTPHPILAQLNAQLTSVSSTLAVGPVTDPNRPRMSPCKLPVKVLLSDNELTIMPSDISHLFEYLLFWWPSLLISFLYGGIILSPLTSTELSEVLSSLLCRLDCCIYSIKANYARTEPRATFTATRL